MNNILQPLVFEIYSYALYFVILSVFFKLLAKMLNFISHMEIGFSEEINFYTTKMIKRTHLISLCKLMLICKLFHKICGLWVGMSDRIMRTRFQDTQELL